MNADYALGFSLMKREDESLRDYAMSFSPFAPFFGVPYRFAAFLKLTPDAAMPFPVAPPAAETPAPAPALAAPAKAKKAATRATAKARDMVEAEIDAGAAVAEAMAATAAPAIPDDMAEAAPGGTEALEPAETGEAATEAAETIDETAVETTAEAVAETATVAPALLYDAAPDVTDDLKLIKGVGPKLEAELNGMGIYTFAQVASMNEANLAWIDDNLTTFKGRSVRDDWIGQANKLLAS